MSRPFTVRFGRDPRCFPEGSRRQAIVRRVDRSVRRGPSSHVIKNEALDGYQPSDEEEAKREFFASSTVKPRPSSASMITSTPTRSIYGTTVLQCSVGLRTRLGSLLLTNLGFAGSHNRSRWGVLPDAAERIPVGDERAVPGLTRLHLRCRRVLPSFARRARLLVPGWRNWEGT